MTGDDTEQVGQRVIRILVDSSDPKDPSKYTFTDDSNDPPGTVGTGGAGDINLGNAEDEVATTCAFILQDGVYQKTAWNTDNPAKNITVVSGPDCPPAGSAPSVPDGWKVMVSSDGRVLSVYDPNTPGTEFSYRLNLKGRKGDHKYDISIDPTIKNVPT